MLVEDEGIISSKREVVSVVSRRAIVASPPPPMLLSRRLFIVSSASSASCLLTTNNVMIYQMEHFLSAFINLYKKTKMIDVIYISLDLFMLLILLIKLASHASRIKNQELS